MVLKWDPKSAKWRKGFSWGVRPGFIARRAAEGGGGLRGASRFLLT